MDVRVNLPIVCAYYADELPFKDFKAFVERGGQLVVAAALAASYGWTSLRLVCAESPNASQRACAGTGPKQPLCEVCVAETTLMLHI